MKRTLCTISALMLLVLLTACGKPPALKPSFSGTVQATDGTINTIGTLTADGDTLTLTLSAPESVAGLSYIFRDGELHTSLRGLDCITPADSLPVSSIPRLLYEIFSRTGDAAYQSSENGVDTFTLTTKGGTAEITAADGAPLTVDLGALSIRLSREEASG